MIILHSISLIERHLQEPRGQSSLRSMNQPQYLNLVKLYREVAGRKQNKVSTLRRLRLNNSLPISRTSTLSPGSIATLLLSGVGVSETKFRGHSKTTLIKLDREIYLDRKEIPLKILARGNQVDKKG